MKHKNLLWTALALCLGLALLVGGLGWGVVGSGTRAEMQLAKGAYLDPHGYLSIPVTTNTVVIAAGSYMDPQGYLSIPVTTNTVVIAAGSYMDPAGYLSIPVTTTTVVSGGSSGGAQAA